MQRDNHKLTLADLINAMGVAGTQDLRGVEVLPWALRIIGRPADPALAHAVAELSAWVASARTGSIASTRARPGNYDQTTPCAHGRVVPRLVKAEFSPVLGPAL